MNSSDPIFYLPNTIAFHLKKHYKDNLMAFYPVSFMLPKFPDTTWISMDFGLTLSNSHGVHNDSVNSICLQYNADTKGDLTCYWHS